MTQISTTTGAILVDDKVSLIDGLIDMATDGVILVDKVWFDAKGDKKFIHDVRLFVSQIVYYHEVKE